jgi:hypothetical protein
MRWIIGSPWEPETRQYRWWQWTLALGAIIDDRVRLGQSIPPCQRRHWNHGQEIIGTGGFG